MKSFLLVALAINANIADANFHLDVTSKVWDHVNN